MEKLTGLFHENTLIDFRVFFLISRRYKIFMVMGGIVFFLVLFYNYYDQPLIFTMNIPLKVEASHRISTDLSSLLPSENKTEITLEEFNVSLSNYTFLKILSRYIVSEPAFDKLNFGNVQSVRSILGSELRKKCIGNEECVISNLTNSIRAFYTLEQGGTENRFKITVNAIDKNTAKVLSRLISKAVEEDRIRIRQYTVQKEINNVTSLIDESRVILQKMGGYTVLQDQEKLVNDITDLKDRVKMLQYNLSIESANAESLQAKLFENKKRTRNGIGDKDEYEKMLKIQIRLTDIKQNINSLTHIPEDLRSASDELIISQLNTERTRLLKSLPPEQRFRAMQIEETFFEKQMENSRNVEFDFLVSKNKIAKLNEDYTSSQLELDKLLKQKMTNEGKLNGMKADLDFLKSLESKQMSLKLINATMNSDIITEEGSQFIDEFRRSSLAKLAMFSFFISGFLYLIALITKYSLDDKIYDEDDIRLYFKNLDFIGETPTFD